MIPLFAVVRVDGTHRRQLFLPLFLLWLLLIPLLLLALPLLLLLALAAPVRSWRGARAFLAVFCAVHGTRVEVSAPHRSLLVHVW